MSRCSWGKGCLSSGSRSALPGFSPCTSRRRDRRRRACWRSRTMVIAHLLYVIGWFVSAALIALSVARPATARLGALFGLGLGRGDVRAVPRRPRPDDPGGRLGRLRPGREPARLARLHRGLGVRARHQADAGRPASDRTASPRRPASPRRSPALASRDGSTRDRSRSSCSRPSAPRPRSSRRGTATPSWPRLRDSRRPSPKVTRSPVTTRAWWSPGTSPSWSRSSRWPRLPRCGARRGRERCCSPARLVALVAQAVSALIPLPQSTLLSMSGISAAQAQAAGLSISAGVTPVYWVFFVFVIALLVSCAWLFTEPGHPAMPAFSGVRLADRGSRHVYRDAGRAKRPRDGRREPGGKRSERTESEGRRSR